MKKAAQENAMMMVKKIRPSHETNMAFAPLFPIPVFMKSFERKPPDNIAPTPNPYQLPKKT